MNNVFKSLCFYILSGIGISLTLKADVGVSSFNSLNAALSAISTIKIGTITFLMNGIFLLFYILLTGGKEIKNYSLIFLSILGLGSIINFFSYSILNGLTIESYFLNILLFISGTCIAGFATGRVIHLNVLRFPIESVCQQLGNKTKIPFRFFRYGVDLFSVITSLLISMIWDLPLYIREGTIISLFLLSGVISFTTSVYENKEKNSAVIEIHE